MIKIEVDKSDSIEREPEEREDLTAEETLLF